METNPPDILVVGHVTIDLAPDGRKAGGAASYASMIAARLGLRTALVTCAGPDLDLAEALPGVHVILAATDRTTVFEHAYEGGRRIQHVRQRAEIIGPAAVPELMRVARLVLLGPVIDEVDPAVASVFPQALIAVTAQGWLRGLGDDGLVEEGQLANFDVAAIAGRAAAVFLSEEDLAGQPIPDSWLEAFPILIVTCGQAGLRLYDRRLWWRLAAFPAAERDPTGAGDALAAAFLVRYGETGDVAAAARFAAAAASIVVEGRGLESVPSRADVERRLSAHPELRLIRET
jgi:sugar/nucleoside kinase (ribokinase family)